LIDKYWIFYLWIYSNNSWCIQCYVNELFKSDDL